MKDAGDPVHLVNLPDRNAGQAAADEFLRSLPALIQNVQTLAKLRHASYVAHVDEGFSPEQALRLCTI